jgi:hypothetical protein
VDLARLTAAERTITLGGRPFRVSPLNFKDFGVLQGWIKDRSPHPVSAIRGHLEGLTESQQAVLLKAAAAMALKWPPRVGSEEANALLGTPEGLTFQLWVVLNKHQAIAIEEVEELMGSITEEEYVRQSEIVEGGEGLLPKA